MAIKKYDFSEILEDIKKKDLKRAYLLYGDENYLKLQYRDSLLKALDVKGDTMNFHRFAGKDMDVGEIISLCETLPFFRDYRVILVEESGFFKNKCDELADYMKNLPEYVRIIFVEAEADKRGRMYKTVRDLGRAAEFKQMEEQDLKIWAARILKREGLAITERDMELFLSRTGSDMTTIHRELEKLISYVQGRTVVTARDIETIGSAQTVNRIFEMVRAVTERNSDRALDLYQDLLSLREPPMRILFLLARQFHQILLVKEYRAYGVSRAEAAQKLGIPEFAVRNLEPLARSYSTEELIHIEEDFVESEEAVKTGRLKDSLSVELLIVRYSRTKKD